MNHNYASLEASKRLEEAGIVLETEKYWFYSKKYGWTDTEMVECDDKIPRAQMAEVWRELPAGTTLYRGEDLSEAFIYPPFQSKRSKINANPTDALIDLLIWVKKEGK